MSPEDRIAPGGYFDPGSSIRLPWTWMSWFRTAIPRSSWHRQAGPMKFRLTLESTEEPAIIGVSFLRLDRKLSAVSETKPCCCRACEGAKAARGVDVDGYPRAEVVVSRETRDLPCTSTPKLYDDWERAQSSYNCRELLARNWLRRPLRRQRAFRSRPARRRATIPTRNSKPHAPITALDGSGTEFVWKSGPAALTRS